MKKEKMVLSYLWIMLFGIGAFYLFNFIYHGAFFQNIFLNDSYDTFMDFFNPVNTEKYDPYNDLNTSYPALACLVFKFFLQFVPIDIQQRNQVGYDFRTTQMTMIVFIIFILVLLWIVAYIIRKKSILSVEMQSLLILLCYLSMPFMFAIERGNLIILTFVCSFFFCEYYDSENKYVKELAYFSLAFAASLKIYPAILGLLICKKGNGKDVFRLTIYGLVMFFVPFFYFDGINSVIMLIKDLKITGSGKYTGLGMNVSLYNLCNTVAGIFDYSISHYMIICIYVLVSLVLAIAFIKLNVKWKKQLALIMFIILIPKTNYYYILIFLIIPFVGFLNEIMKQEEYNMMNIKYAIIFAIIFVPTIFGKIPCLSNEVRYYVTYSMLFDYLAVLWIVIAFLEEIIENKKIVKFIDIGSIICSLTILAGTFL